jgi:hypothetical protein
MKYSNEGRQELRKAIINHNGWTVIEKLIGRKVSSLSINELEMVADKLGIDFSVYAIGKYVTTSDKLASLLAGDPVTLTEIAPVAAAVAGLSVPEIIAAVTEIAPVADQWTADLVTEIAPEPEPEPVTEIAPEPFTPVGTVRKTIKDVFGLKSKDLVTVHGDCRAPKIDPLYSWQVEVLRSVLAICSDPWATVWLTGAAGTGKTTFARQLAARLGRPFYRINHTANTEAPLLLGMTVPHDGRVIWQDGPLSAALREPSAVILLDEPSLASPGVMGIYHSLIEPGGSVTLENGEILELSPDCIIIAADNTSGHGDESGLYQGVQLMNRAFLDRFAIILDVPWLSPGIEADIVGKRSGINLGTAAMLVDFAGVTREKNGKAELSAPVGIRRLVAMGKLLAKGMTIRDTLAQSVLPYCPPEDVEAVRQVASACFPSQSDMAVLVATGVLPPQPVKNMEV